MVFVIEYVFDAYLNSSVFVKSVCCDVMLVLSLFSCISIIIQCNSIHTYVTICARLHLASLLCLLMFVFRSVCLAKSSHLCHNNVSYCVLSLLNNDVQDQSTKSQKHPN